MHALICTYHLRVCFYQVVFCFHMPDDKTDSCIAGLVDQMT